MDIRQPLPRTEYGNHLAVVGSECVFCTMSDGLNIKEYSHWTFTYAAFPYRHYHTLIVAKRHVIKFSELTTDELSELAQITEDVESIFRKSGVVGSDSEFGTQLFFSWRSRDNSELRKRAVSHLHLHAFPEFPTDIETVVKDDAWKIDMDRLKL